MLLNLPRPSIRIQTRSGNDIPLECGWIQTQQDVDKHRRWLDHLLRQRNLHLGRQVIERSAPTSLYNCHGMTLLFRRARAYEEAVRRVMEDDQYYDVPMQVARPGDLIIYYDDIGGIDHSGVVIWVDPEETPAYPWILSKWGEAGEYIHRYHHCLYDCRNVRFVREGRQ